MVGCYERRPYGLCVTVIDMTAIRNTTWSATALLAAAGVGIAAGAATAYLQGVLSATWNTVANSGAVWTLIAAAAAAVLGRQRATAISTGMLVLVGEVAGYYAYVGDVRHVPVLRAEELLWTVAALWIGPLAGLAAFHARWGRPDHRVVALVAGCGILAGEGLYLWRLAGVPGAGRVEALVGVAAAAAALSLVPAPVRARLIASGAGLLVATAVYLAYSQPLIA
jgi:hypothetical protein